MTGPPPPPPEPNRPPGYEPPRLTVLGTLQELTRGGDVAINDGNGFSGASGMLP